MALIDDLSKFLVDINEEISSNLEAYADEGANPTQLFTDHALQILTEVNEAENTFILFDEKITNRGIEHRINAYSYSDNYDTVNLYITDFSSSYSPETLTKTDSDRLIRLAVKFFENAFYRNSYTEMEESAEAFELAHSLATETSLRESIARLTVTVLTNRLVKKSPEVQKHFENISTIVRVVDLEYLYNISKKERSPIIIGQDLLGTPLPCISSNLTFDGFQSYLAIIPGVALAAIYETYGLRLLESNVRSFLQFTGKINKGIRDTILNQPHMFLAYNNGISATAEKIHFYQDQDTGKAIVEMFDFQIVNGGQTTSALFHVWKKDSLSVKDVYVPMKITVLEQNEQSGEVIAKIAEYANTQNRIVVSDLSANKKVLITLEAISRSIWAQGEDGKSQTRWFFERARGQYKNERALRSKTPTERKKFTLQNPSKQIITKELLAKYINTWDEVIKGKKTLIGPHIVVRGGQKNFQQYLIHNCPEQVDERYFKQSVSKAIMFKAAENIYGVKPNALGDLRYIIVPYTLSLISYKTEGKFDLMLIWKDQRIPEALEYPLRNLMIMVEAFIKSNAPGSLYGEWAKKAECWEQVKNNEFDFDFSVFEDYYVKDKISQFEPYNSGAEDRKASENIIKSFKPEGWEQILINTKGTGITTPEDAFLMRRIIYKLNNDITFSQKEINQAMLIFFKIQDAGHDIKEFCDVNTI